MSGWIKLEKDIENDPRVLRMAKKLDRMFLLFLGAEAELDPCNAVALPTVTLVSGALARLWIYADSHIREDNTLDMSEQELDDWLGIPGFCSVMPSDWLQVVGENCLELPNFQEKNGVEAKRRALVSKRVAKHRVNASALQGEKPCNAPALPDQTRPDQTKTSRKKAPAAPVAPSAPFQPQAVEGLDVQSWTKWIAYRSSIKKPIKPASMQAAAEEMAKHGPEQAAYVQHSIANGYTGLYGPKINGATPRPAGPKPKKQWVIDAENELRAEEEARRAATGS